MSYYEDAQPAEQYPGGYFQPQTTGYEHTQYVQPYEQPQYGAQPAYAPQPVYYVPPQPAAPPVVVNVTQNAGGAGVLVVRRPVHNGMHATLTLLTGGLWAPIWLWRLRSRRVLAVHR